MAWEPGFTFAERRYELPLQPRRPELPPAVEGRTNPIDRILDADLAQRNRPRPPPIDDAAFLRRLSLDVIGLLPRPSSSGLLHDPGADRRAPMVRTVLDDKRAYADHWLAFWNDLLRNEYRGHRLHRRRPEADPGWLYKSLLDEQAVRPVRPRTDRAEARVGRVHQGHPLARADQREPGRELQFCAERRAGVLRRQHEVRLVPRQLHRSWKLEGRLRAGGRHRRSAARDLPLRQADRREGAAARFLCPELGTIDPEAPKAKRLERLADLVTHPENGRFTRTIVNRIWQRLMGRGIVHPVDMMGNQPWNEDLLDYLAGYLVDHGYDMKKLLAHIVTSQAYQSQTSAPATRSRRRRLRLPRPRGPADDGGAVRRCHLA